MLSFELVSTAVLKGPLFKNRGLDIGMIRSAYISELETLLEVLPDSRRDNFCKEVFDPSNSVAAGRFIARINYKAARGLQL